ncbi:vomeronasal type-2 receptor 26-like [Protopterus annectens]|uniref:vomeronasal type-2 receptor 26-like n=1 Tax=Protopterus annectens TaxID=7888 RepID=UPI001CF9DC42|nr:vomeronasal type-2 receptor 26-like [Protopterus annectens]
MKCIPKTVDFLSFEESLGSTLTGLAMSASCFTVYVICIFIKYHTSPIVRANNRELSFILLIALTLCFLCSLLFIGRPMKFSCLLRQPAFGVIFSICISTILAKTIVVVIAFNASKPSSSLRKWVGSRWISISIILFGCFVQLVICTAWLVVATPFPQNNMLSDTGKIIIECNEGSVIIFYCMLGYLGLLSTICFLVAFLVRNLPDQFNEAKHITFSMLVFICVWLSFIPAYLSTKGKYTVAVEIFSILASTAGLFSCIFIPKVYIIVWRPDLNTREKLIQR